MNSKDSAAPQSQGDEPPAALPELNTKLLTDGELSQLLRDIELCAQITEIIPKFVAQGHVHERASVTLEEARQLLSDRAVRGLQFRYRYDNADWWDTLMLAGSQFRLVRIRHNFSAENIRPSDPAKPAFSNQQPGTSHSSSRSSLGDSAEIHDRNDELP